MAFKIEKILGSQTNAPELTIKLPWYDLNPGEVMPAGTLVDFCDGLTGHSTTGDPQFVTACDAVADGDGAAIVPCYIVNKNMIFRAPVVGGTASVEPGYAYKVNSEGCDSLLPGVADNGALCIEVISGEEILCAFGGFSAGEPN